MTFSHHDEFGGKRIDAIFSSWLDVRELNIDGAQF
jgi:hypothetical protein